MCWRLLFNKVADLQALFFLDFTNELNALLCNNVSEGTTFNFSLIHYCPVLLFYTPWKHQKIFRFSDVFRGYRKATLGCNGLKQFLCDAPVKATLKGITLHSGYYACERCTAKGVRVNGSLTVRSDNGLQICYFIKKGSKTDVFLGILQNF